MRSSSVLFANASALAVMMGVTPAYGQVVGPPEVVVPAEEEEEEQEEEDVVRDASGQPAQGGTITVTGSRIRLPNLESFEPIVTMDEEYIEDRNLQNVADALNELPAYRGSVTPQGGQGTFGQGVNFVNNFGLGSNRTLTLVNGRRFVSSNVATVFNNAAQGTQVDLNVIPTVLVDRIDTVAVGGAPVYGSDAISGTVNVILKTRFEGFEVRGLTGITEEGDNFRYAVGGVGGINFAGDRGNLTVAVDYNEERGVLQSDRDFFRDDVGNIQNPCPNDATAPECRGIRLFELGRPANDRPHPLRLNPNIGFNTGPNDQVPAFVLARGIRLPFLTGGGLIFGGPLNRQFQFDPSGNLVPFNIGTTLPSLRALGASDEAFRFSDFGQITSDLRRFIVNSFFNFDLTDSITFFAEGTYFHSRADELVQQPSFNTVLFGGASGALVFRNDNPFLTDQARQVLASRNVTQFTISRFNTDLADLTGFGENEIWRGVAGFRGEFNLIDRVFNWEVSANHGRTEIRTFRQDINRQNFINAVNVTRDASGNIVCTTARTRTGGNGFAAPGGTPVADPNCVPLNLLGEGRASQAARDYVIEDVESLAVNEQTIFNANIGSTLFNLWGAGWSGFNVGYEHRRESADFTPSEFEQQGLGRAVAISPVSGEYNVDEVFGEVVIPLVGADNNIPVVHRAEIFGRGRYVHNTVNGGFFAWTAGGALAPVPDVEFRGNYTKSFRAPAVGELFSPITNAFAAVPFPCTNPTAGNNPEARQRNCAAFLARFPNTLQDPSRSATVPILTGGNPDLDNEEASSYTFGVILRPRWVPRLSMTADYISIDLNQPIANLSVAAIATACFDNDEFDVNDPANANRFCRLIRRHPAGTIGTLPNGQQGDIGGFVIVDPANPAVRAGFVNGNRIFFSGIQGTLNYSTARGTFGLPGSLDVGVNALYVRRRIVDITGVAPARSDGQIGDPTFSANGRIRYTTESWGVATFINYVGRQLFDRQETGNRDVLEIDQLDDYVTVNTSVFFDPTENFRVTLSVTNLFNRHGEEYFGFLIPASRHDPLGRRFAASARVRF
ncbi:MAG: TonB-dependent receptor [Pseudomonadota bacterium]|nr:TonB-dependent receptor [Pseudomonadota bacterium]